jgi:hypothetical protein
LSHYPSLSPSTVKGRSQIDLTNNFRVLADESRSPAARQSSKSTPQHQRPLAQSAQSSSSATPTTTITRTPSIPMSDPKSKPSSKGSSQAAKESTEHAQFCTRSKNDPSTSTPSRTFSESYSSPSGTTNNVATGKRLSQLSLRRDATGDEQEDDEYKSDEDDKKPTVTKRHSHHSHTNVHTECGRHGDEWLFGPITEAVKSVFKKK